MTSNEPVYTDTTRDPRQEPPSAGSRSSRLACQALRQNADLFEAAGMRRAEDSETSILLKDHDLSLLLEHRLQRRLFSRIYNLRANLEVGSSGSYSNSSYRLTLKASGLVNASYSLTPTGSGTQEGHRVAQRVMEAGLLAGLTSKVDLENLCISWTPEARVWWVTLDPYPGSHIQMLIPPIRYTVKLQEQEVKAIQAFLMDLSNVLRSMPN